MAFNSGLPGPGGIIVALGILFAFSTLVSWAFYGERCVEYLWNKGHHNIQVHIYTICHSRSSRA